MADVAGLLLGFHFMKIPPVRWIDDNWQAQEVALFRAKNADIAFAGECSIVLDPLSGNNQVQANYSFNLADSYR